MPFPISPTYLLPMSLRRSERLSAAPSKHTQNSTPQPTTTRKSRRTIRQLSGARITTSTSPVPRPSRSRSAAKRPRAIAEYTDDDDADQEHNGDNDGSLTDPAKVQHPVISLVDPALAAAWRVNQKHNICFIFDAVSPARRFKRGTVFNEEANFPEDTHNGDITETDGPGPGWISVDPGQVGCIWKHFPHC